LRSTWQIGASVSGEPAEGIARITPSLLEIFSGLFEEEFLSLYEETYRQGAEELAAGGS
jgi:hypothetical protein